MSIYAELTIDQGTTFLTTMDLVNDDGSPVDVSDYDFTSQIKKSYYSTGVTANISVGIVSAANGNINLSMTATETAAVRPGRYLYDVKMTSNTTNTTIRVIEGIVTVTPQVSS